MKTNVSELKDVLAGFRGIETLARSHPDGSLPASKAMIPLNLAFEDVLGSVKKWDTKPSTRMLEIALEGYQGLEELGREYLEEEGRPLWQVLKPLNDWTEKLLAEMEAAPSNGAQGTVVDIDKHR